MVEGRTGRVLEPSRARPRPRLKIVSGAEPTVDRVPARPALLPAVAVAVAAAVIGRRRARDASPSAPGRRTDVREQKKVMIVFLAAGVVVLAAWRPVVSAYRDHRYNARWRRQPLGW
jgi:hypothetical protein